MIPEDQAGYARVLRAGGCASAIADIWGQAMADTIKPDTFSAGTEKELPDFLTTILWESAYLSRLKESGKYSAARIRELGLASPEGSRWRSLVPRADSLANNEYAFFEAVYGGRMGNGPEGSGDGAAHAGIGPIQLTGLDGYAWLAARVGQDVGMIRELMQQPHFAVEFCISWWEGKVPDYALGDEAKVRKIVNGGTFGLEEVRKLYAKIKGALNG